MHRCRDTSSIYTANLVFNSILVITLTVITACLSILRHYVMTSLSVGHRIVFSGKEKQCFINVFKVSIKRTSETTFKHEIHGLKIE